MEKSSNFSSSSPQEIEALLDKFAHETSQRPKPTKPSTAARGREKNVVYSYVHQNPGMIHLVSDPMAGYNPKQENDQAVYLQHHEIPYALQKSKSCKSTSGETRAQYIYRKLQKKRTLDRSKLRKSETADHCGFKSALQWALGLNTSWQPVPPGSQTPPTATLHSSPFIGPIEPSALPKRTVGGILVHDEVAFSKFDPSLHRPVTLDGKRYLIIDNIVAGEILPHPAADAANVIVPPITTRRSLFNTAGDALRSTARIPELVSEFKSYVDSKDNDFRTWIKTEVFANLKQDASSLFSSKLNEAVSLFSDKFLEGTIILGCAIVLIKIFYDLYHSYNHLEAGLAVLILGFLTVRYNLVGKAIEKFNDLRTSLIPTEDAAKHCLKADTFEKLGDAAALFLTGCFVKVNPDKSRIKSLCTAFSHFKHLRDGTTDLAKTIFKAFRNWFNQLSSWLFGEGAYQFKDLQTGVGAVDSWATEVAHLNDAYSRKALQFTPEEHEELQKLRSRGLDLLRTAGTMKDNQLLGVIRDYLRIIEHMTRLFEVHGVSKEGPRFVPVAIRLYGRPGVGKTSAIYPLASECLLYAYRNDPSKLQDIKSRLAYHIYGRDQAQGFWNGYFGQSFTVYDEYEQQRGAAGIFNNEQAETLHIVGPFDYDLNMASLEQKGQTFFLSRFVVYTTNSKEVQADMIRSKEAIERRMTVDVQVLPKLKYCKAVMGLTDEPAYDDQRLLNVDLIPRNHGKKCFSTDVYEFRFLSGPKKGHITDWAGFIAYIKEKYDQHESEWTASRDFQKTTHQALADAYLARHGVPPVTPSATPTPISRVEEPITEDRTLLKDRTRPKEAPEALIEAISAVLGESSSDERDSPAMPDPVDEDTATHTMNGLSARDSALSVVERHSINQAYREDTLARVRINKFADQFGWSDFEEPADVIEHYQRHGRAPGCPCARCVTAAMQEPPPPYEPCPCAVCLVPGEGMKDRPTPREWTAKKKAIKIINSDTTHDSPPTPTLWTQFKNQISNETGGYFGGIGHNINRAAHSGGIYLFDINAPECRVTYGQIVERLCDTLPLSTPPHRIKWFAVAYTTIYLSASTPAARSELGLWFDSPDFATADHERALYVYFPLTLEDVKVRMAAVRANIESQFQRFITWVGLPFRDMESVMGFLLVIGLSAIVVFYIGLVIAVFRQWFGAKEVEHASGEVREYRPERKVKTRKVDASVAKHTGDDNALAQANAIWCRSYYGLFVEDDDVDPLCHVLFIVGKLGLMNYHCVSMIKDQILQKKIAPDHKFWLFSPTRRYRCPVLASEIAAAKVLPDHIDSDLALIEVTSQAFQDCPDIRKYLMTEKEHKLLHNFHCLMMAADYKDDGSAVLVEQITDATTGTSMAFTKATAESPSSRVGLIRRHMRCEVGQCGTPWFAMHPQLERKLVGIVVGTTTNYGYAVPVSREYFDKLAEQYKAQHTGFLHPIPLDTLDRTLVPGFEPVAVVSKPPPLGDRTQIIPSPMMESFAPHFPPKTAPAMLRPTRAEDDSIIDPWQVVYKYDKPPLHTSEYAVPRLAAKMFYAYMVKNSQVPMKARILSFEEAVYGVASDPDLAGITRGTSPGYPFTLEQKGRPGKTRWMGADGELDDTDPNFKDLRRQCDEAMDSLDRNELPSLPFTDILKDERRPIEKAKTGQTRYISGSNMVYLILSRMYFGVYRSWKIKNRIHNCSTSGVNPHSQEWDIMVRHLHSRGKNIGDFDVKSMDASNSAEMMYIVLHEGVYRWMKENAGLTDRDKRIMKGLIKLLMYSEHIRGRYIYRWRGALSSGTFMTVVVNDETLANLTICAFGELHPKGLSEMVKWEHFIALLTHGDDNTEGVSDEITSWFTPRTMAKIFAKYGYILTDATKKELTDSWKPIEAAQFLKRGFLYNGRLGVYVANLSTDTALEMIMWARKDPNMIQYSMETFDMAIKEMSLHPKPVYDHWAPLMFKAYREAFGYPYPIEDQAALQDATREMGLYCARSASASRKLAQGQELHPLAYQYSSETKIIVPAQSHELGVWNPIQGYYSATNLQGKQAENRISRTKCTSKGERCSAAEQSISNNTSDSSSLTVIESVKSTITPVAIAPTPVALPTAPSTTNVNEDIMDFLSRPILVGSGTITTATTGTFYNLILPDMYFALNIVARKLEGFQGISGTFNVRLLVSGTSGQQGIVGMYYVPQAVVSGFLVSIRTADNTHASQLPRAEAYIGTDEGCEMDIPFVGPNLYHSFLSGAGDWGVVYMRMYSGLKVGNGSNSCNYSIYVSMKPGTVQLFNPTYNVSPFPALGSMGRVNHGEAPSDEEVAKHTSNSKPSRKKKENPDTKEKEATGTGIVSKSLNVLSNVTAVGGLFIPELAPIAEPAAWVLSAMAKKLAAWGWSKPRSETPASSMLYRSSLSGHNYDGVSTAVSLGGSSVNRVDVIDGFAGSPYDELAFDYLLGKYTWLGNINWDTTVVAGVSIMSRSLSPSVMKITNIGPPVNYSGGPVGYFGDMFNMYHGSFKLRLRFSKTPYHEGRLAVVFYPGLTSNQTYDKASYANQEIIDIREGLEWEFIFPYTSQQYYLPTSTSYGLVQLYVINPLVAPSIAADNVDINLEWAAAPGFEYAFPRGTQMAVYSPTVTSADDVRADHCAMATPYQSKKILTPIGQATSTDQGVDYARACIGEKMNSAKQLLLMRNRPMLTGITGVAGMYYRFRPFCIGIAKGATLASDWADWSADYISLIAPLYAYSRGGVEISFDTKNNTLSGYSYSYVTPNYDNITQSATKTTAPPTNFNACRSPGVDGRSFSVYVPQYSWNQCRLNRVSLSIGSTGTTEPNDQWTSPVLLWLEMANAVVPIIWRSAADDYQLGCFLGVPNWILGTNSNDPAPSPSVRAESLPVLPVEGTHLAQSPTERKPVAAPTHGGESKTQKRFPLF